MPFKLRLKKSRQYNVVSKSLFVICIELLDSNSIECTLSAESSGRECLDSVCQRLGLQQPEFFGLRYISRHGPPHLRWVEMDRPLKKQLDKHAREPSLHLRVMYYVHGISLLQDETTRYHYFLQLKMDINEDRMSCDPKQAVLLASYSMQAEFGHHDPERHTAEYLKDFNLFPKHLTEQGHLESLTEGVICQHAALAGLPQSTAEEYFILAAQRLDGYGQETFVAKDESGSETIIGVSLSGVFVGYDNPAVRTTTKFYRWRDITNVINHKRCFGIECQAAEENVQFQFPDPESAKYVWRMCVHQHTFYMQNEQATEQGTLSGEPHTGSLLRSNLEDNLHLMESREELDGRDLRGEGGLQWGEPLAVVHRGQFASCVDLTTPHDIDKLRALLPSYRPAPDYETAVQHKFRRPPPPAGLYSSQPEIHRGRQYPDVAQVYLEMEGRREVGVPPLHTYSTPDLDTMVQGLQLLHLYKPPPPYPIGRPCNSTPDLASSQTLRPPRPTYIAAQVSGSSPDLVSSRGVGVMQLMQRCTHPNLALLDPSVAYCTGGAARQRATTMPYHSAAHNYVDAASEPIYENVPLPWAASGAAAEAAAVGAGRSRASSVQSAPEMRSENGPARPPQIAYEDATERYPGQHGGVHMTRAGATSPHELSSYSLPFPSKSKAGLGEGVPEHSPYSTPNTSSSGSLGEKKPKRKWGLLGGGKSKAKSSKSGSLTKSKSGGEETGIDDRHRWSLGLPRGPLPSSISKETMCQLLEKKLADSQLFFEFEKIPKKKNNPDFTVAAHPDNIKFNRYKDVLPYEENRVRLTPSKENRHGYYNASHITATVGSHQRFYVAAQGPLPATLASFWQTVWEADVYLIVMLAGAQEEGNTGYCPVRTDGCLDVGEFQVWRQFSQETGHCVTTKLRLYHTASRRIRGVWHLQYTEWGDQGCPNSVGHFLGFLEELSSVRQHAVGEIPPGHNRNPPALVHCTAGVGRTGVAVLSDLLLDTLDHNQDLDVPQAVAQLRLQRMLMVQTVAQYRFVYTLLIHYLKHSRLI